MEIADANSQKGRGLRGLLDRNSVSDSHASLRSRWMLIADRIFISGCVCGVVNAYYRVILEKTDDGMRHMLPVLVTSIVEINIAIIVGCMPAFKHFVQTHLVFKKSFQFFSFSYFRSRMSTTRRSGNTPSGDFRKFDHHTDSKSNLKENPTENSTSERRGKEDISLEDRSGSPVWIFQNFFVGYKL